jgi:hypothetical protein
MFATNERRAHNGALPGVCLALSGEHQLRTAAVLISLGYYQAPLEVLFFCRISVFFQIFVISYKMRLLTHNMLMCNVKGCSTNNFPLQLKATSIQKEESEFNPDFVKHMLPKLDYNALVTACKDVSAGLDCPIDKLY